MQLALIALLTGPVIAVGDVEHDAGDESAQQCIDAELVCQGGEYQQHHETAAHSQLRGRLVGGQQRLAQPGRPPEPPQADRAKHGGGPEREYIRHLDPGRLGLGGEQDRQQQQRAELADRARHDCQLAELGAGLAGIAQHGHHDAQ